MKVVSMSSGQSSPTSESPPPSNESNATGRRVLVVGGGLAGLAAASRLGRAGYQVTLVESRNKLGGRATSFVDPTTGEMVDNCQHVSMGCCTNLADFCETVGIAPLLQTVRTLYFQDEKGRISTMRAAPLPAPLHLFPSFLSAKYLTLWDKIRIGWGMLSLMWSPPRLNVPFDQWLLSHGQTPRTIDRFWGLVLVSALNETIDRMDFRYARQVFVEGFLQNGRAFYVEIPSVPLGQFYGSLLENWLAKNGIVLKMGTAISKLKFDRGRVIGAELKDGSTIEADTTVLAVPHHRVRDLFPTADVERDHSIPQLDYIETSPITSVHLWYDRPVMDYPHLVGVGRNVQWLFRRTGDEGGYVQAVISASRELSSHSSDEILNIIRAEVEEMLPQAKEATLKHSRVVTERRATFSVLPGIDHFRPDARSVIPGLVLAGDYTQTGWPATMEGAVRSGYLAAAAVRKMAEGVNDTLVSPLRAGWLFKLLGGRN